MKTMVWREARLSMSELRDPKATGDLFLKKVLARMEANREANRLLRGRKIGPSTLCKKGRAW
jgi:hypothetical protein